METIKNDVARTEYQELEEKLFGRDADFKLSKETRLIRDVLEKNEVELSYSIGMFQVSLPNRSAQQMRVDELVAYSGNLLYEETKILRQKALETFQIEPFTKEYNIRTT